MKIYISADIEGISGVSNWEDTSRSSIESIKQMTREVSAACSGANSAGVDEILVKDAHGSGRNINPLGLPQNVKLHRDWSMGPLRMMEALDSSFDAVVFVGYHAGAMMPGNPLAHTFSNGKFQNIKINGNLVSEFDINSYIAHYFNVPVIMISGDQGICSHAKEKYDHIETVAVMESIGDSNVSVHPDMAVKAIEEGIKVAMTKDLKALPIDLPDSFDCLIEFKEAKYAYRASFYPEVTRIDEKRIQYKTQDYMSFLRMFLFI